MDWVLIGAILLVFSVSLTIISGFIYILARGKTKVTVFAQNLLMLAMFLVMCSFVIVIYDFITAFDKAPIEEGEILISATEFVRVERRNGIRFECEVLDKNTNQIFTFSSNKEEEVKSYCHEFEIGSTYHVFFKDVHRDYHLIKGIK